MTSEQHGTPYLAAARFPDEQAAHAAYQRIQDLLFNAPDCDLSAYRLHIRGIWQVAIVGVSPKARLSQKLATALALGTLVSLDTETLDFLQHRRKEESERGTWVERHHRPGLGFRFRR